MIMMQQVSGMEKRMLRILLDFCEKLVRVFMCFYTLICQKADKYLCEREKSSVNSGDFCISRVFYEECYILILWNAEYKIKYEKKSQIMFTKLKNSI